MGDRYARHSERPPFPSDEGNRRFAFDVLPPMSVFVFCRAATRIAYLLGQLP